MSEGINRQMRKKILAIAYHYPPIHRSSGVHRTVNFVRSLPDYGWDPSVLTVHPRAYDEADTGITGDNQPPAPVHRAFALDTRRHLSIKGRYAKFMSIPDRWISWWLGAIPSGLSMIRRNRPDIIWSTYPIATTHLIALTLHKLTGIPWIADFRDPMTDEDYPTDPTVRKVFQWIERKAVQHCSRAIFTTTDTLELYTRRFPEINRSKYAVISNGYDEASFAEAEKSLQKRPRPKPPEGQMVFVHSGILYRSERNPEPFFNALAELHKEQFISPDTLKIILRASGDEDYYHNRLKQLGLEGIVFLETPVPYAEALREILSVDGLLLFQAANCNHQIPAKAYEYIRSARPVLTLTDHGGNTAALMKEAGYDTIADIESKENIKNTLITFINGIRQSDLKIPGAETIACYSRKQKTGDLAAILDAVVSD